MIQGEEKQYQIGDILSLNCTSGKSSPRSILTFYINDEPVSMKINDEIWLMDVALTKMFSKKNSSINSLPVTNFFLLDLAIVQDLSKMTLVEIPKLSFGRLK